MPRQFETKILGGLSVTITYRWDRYSDCLDTWWISHINGRFQRKGPQWLYKRLTPSEEGRLDDECAEHYRETI